MDQSPPDDTLSTLERTRERLYATAEPKAALDGSLTPGAYSAIPRAWQTKIGTKQHVHLASRFFAVAALFFVAAAGISAFLFFTGTNTVSVDNIELTVQGPTTASGGDTVPLSIVVTNKNPTTIQNATLEVTFPEGTRSAEDLTKAYPRYTENLGALTPGQTVERTVKAVLFGSQGTQAGMQIALSFGTERSNAVFVKRANYPITISTAPLSVALDTVTETVSGKPFTLRATVRSNATTAVDGVVLQAQLPPGFTLVTSSIPPVGTTFLIGTLAPGASKTVTLTGTLTGQDSEVRAFHFAVGTARASNDPTLAVTYMSQDASVTITAPFLVTTVTVNGSSAATPAVAPGSTVIVNVSWSNALATSVNNGEIDVALSGALDPASVQVQRGFYRSADRTIIFSRDTDPALGSLAPGATGLGVFTFTVPTSATRNASIGLSLSIAGERIGQSGVPEQVTASASKTINIVSAVAFKASALHSSGPFTNTGPIPPVPDQATTYTVNWAVTNTGNDLADARVSASLPPYVNFGGVVMPDDGSFVYTPSSRTITWRPGDMPGGATRSTAFQITFTPSITQSGSSPTLTSAPAFSAYDRFAQVSVTTQGAAVTTETPGDPGYTLSKGTVQ